MSEKPEDRRESFVSEVTQSALADSYSVAYSTVSYIRKLIAHSKWLNSDDLIKLLQNENRLLNKALPKHFVVSNMLKRIIKLVRDEDSTEKGSEFSVSDAKDSLHKLFHSASKAVAAASNKQLRRTIIETVGEFLVELETCAENIHSQAGDHITNGDVVISIGHSKAVEGFLKAAAKKTKFTLIVAECAPFYKGKVLADSFKGNTSVNVQLIKDTAIFSSMTQANKAIIGARTVFADGGIQAVCGAYTICLAAKHFCVPVIVCAAFYKLTPVFTSQENHALFNAMESPDLLIPFSSGGDLVGRIEAYNPVFDYVQPDLITLFITNVSGNVPSYIYRLLSELYHPEDTDI